MSKTVHVGLSVRGALNWNKRRLAGLFSKGDGTRTTAGESRERLLDLLSQGWEMLPLGACEGFDKKTGCPGHEEPGR